jgi:hypothetical protein
VAFAPVLFGRERGGFRFQSRKQFPGFPKRMLFPAAMEMRDCACISPGRNLHRPNGLDYPYPKPVVLFSLVDSADIAALGMEKISHQSADRGA